jgi:outer membrane protein TolC
VRWHRDLYRLFWRAKSRPRVSLIAVLDADANLLQVRDARAQAQTEAAIAAIGSFRT